MDPPAGSLVALSGRAGKTKSLPDRIKRVRFDKRQIARDPNPMTATDPMAQVRELQHKFDYAFVSLTLGTLALSVQFSPRAGTQYAVVLVIAWSLMFISAVIGGYRLVYGPIYLGRKIMSGISKDWVARLSYQRSIGGEVISPETGAPITEERVDAKIEQHRKIAAEHDKKAEKLQAHFPTLFNWQVGLHLIAMLMNGFFVAVNFLAGTMKCN